MRNDSNLVDAYLFRLRSRLLRRLPGDVADDHVNEIRMHLNQSIADQVLIGVPEDRAIVDSLRRVGSDALVADGLIRTHSGIADLPVWRLAWLPTLIGLAYCFIPLMYTEGPTPEWLPAVLWLPSCFLVAFSYACWRSRRFLLTPIAVGAFVVFSGLILQTVAFSPIGLTKRSQEMRSRSLIGYQRQIANCTLSVTQARSLMAADGRRIDQSGQAERVAPKRVRDVEFASGPYSPIEREVDHGWTVNLAPVTTIAEAKDLWRKNGSSYIQMQTQTLQRAEADYQSFRALKLDGAELTSVMLRIGTAVLTILGIVATLNASVLGLGMLYRVAIARRWRPERLIA